MNILNSANTAATINKIIHNSQGTTKTSEGATAAGKIIKENLPDIISAGFDMPHPTSVFEGVPPFSFISNGDPLVNWTIYGNTVEGVSVGDKTANLYNSASATLNGRLYSNRAESVEGWAYSDYINVEGMDYISISRLASINTFYFYEDKTDNSISYGNEQTIAIPQNAKYVRINMNIANVNSTVLVSGSTVSSTYIPFGYKIPVICGGVTTNIYIDEPLTAGETISYNDTGVIIPTTMFLNTLSVGTTVQPEKVFIEYVK